ncbi:MAG: TonB-dependent receptor plug domain-containing protein, partial [Burkholderiaceae bacterium]|nr:TonB-dependent receptor plug domain-containing protein [Burkholderiaceae bacterium]
MTYSNQHRHIALYPITAAIALFSATGAGAQQTQVMQTITIEGPAVQDGLELARQNATASCPDLRADELPASVESLSAATMQASGDLQVKDAITRGTGLTDMSSPGNGIVYSTRGFGGNNAIAILENGQRLLVSTGTATYPSAPWGYEVIEVLRGPGSVVYGSGTTGATINAVRKAAQRTTSVEAMAGVGGGKALRAGVSATGALGADGSFRVDAYADRSDGFIDRRDARHGKLLTCLTYALTPDLTLDAQLDHAEQQPQRNFGTPLVNGQLAGHLRNENYNVGDADIRYADDKAVARL